MKKIVLLILIFLCCLGTDVTAQIKKFGKVAKDEFKIEDTDQYKDQNAVVLFKKRKTSYTFNDKTGWDLETNVQERILIVNQDGYKYATKRIALYTGNNGIEKASIKANTYNLVNNKIEKTKLSKSDIFDNKTSEYWSEKKFTMPNLTEGCIIEWEYTITSPFIQNVNDIVFQYDIPIKYIESKVIIPEYFKFKYEASKFFDVVVNESTKNRNITLISKTQTGYLSRNTKMESDNVSLFENIYEVKLNNVAPLKIEPYVNSMQNYIGKVEFELVGVKYPNSEYKSYANNWNDVCKTIYKSESFGGELNKKSYFKGDIDNLIADTSDPMKRAAMIFNFVRAKVKWNEYYGTRTNDGVRSAYKNGSGNVAEINLMLTAMLRYAGLEANPVLVSTRHHGIPLFPTIDGFNYVICGIELPEHIVLLDATDPFSEPNVLPFRALNWNGRIVRKTGSSAHVDLFPKVYSVDHKRVNITLSEDMEVSGTMRESYTKNYGMMARKRYVNLSEEEVLKRLEKNYDNFVAERARVSNLDKIAKPVIISSKFGLENSVEEIGDKVFFSPLFFLKESENAFKADARKYPIDFGYPYSDKYEVIITLPENVSVEKIPESAGFDMENGYGNFSYEVKVEANKIILLVNTKINTPIISNLNYDMVKEFFNQVVLKHEEKVVLKKS